MKKFFAKLEFVKFMPLKRVRFQPNHLHILAVFAAFLFIPAFIYGYASVWSIVFGIVLALLFDARLQQILDRCEPVKPERARCIAVIGQYFLLMLEMSIVSSAVPIIFLYSGITEHSVSSLDALLLDYSPLGFLKAGAYAQDGLNFQILIAATSPVFVSLIGTIFLSVPKLAKAANFILYAEVRTVENGEEIYHGIRRAWYIALGDVGFILSSLPSTFYILFFMNDVRLHSFQVLDFALYISAAFVSVYYALSMFIVTIEGK